ncbi:MAG: hypothetical protein LWW86_01370 [Micrococcales bacterium]|nr:hypothetical protein [Micrococcales bacterium]
MSPIRHLRRLTGRRVELLPMTPMEQLRAGRLPHRLVQLVVGLYLFGAAAAMLVESTLGLTPWEVFHYGVMTHVGLSLGTVVVITSFVVLLLWLPLRQWPGLGTIANSLLIGPSLDLTLHLLPSPGSLAARVALLLGAIVVNGIGGAMYIGAQLGPGPRDGLMTGISHRSGLSHRIVRTAIEITVLVIGWFLGGIVGVGTVVYALLIGPSVQFFLPMLTVRLDHPRASTDPHAVGPAPDDQGHAPS